MLAAILIPAISVAGYEDARLMRFPDTNGERVVFSYAGDIWSVDADGGEAKKLTSHKGIELFPRISPDGRWIAFSGQYSGSRQVYVMPAEGGTPKQLTYYNDVGDMPPRGGFDHIVLGWSSDSEKILFRANRTQHGQRIGKYFTISPKGGFEQELPVPLGGFASLSPDSEKIAFTYPDREFRTWKRYKGGRATDVWIFDMEEMSSEKITDFVGSDQIPVWYGDKVYFASDEDMRLNIHSYDVKTKSREQLTSHEDYDVMWPSGSNGFIAYEVGGYIYKLNLQTGDEERVEVSINYDNKNTIPYFKNVEDDIHSMHISPSGKRVLFDARGDIFSVPASEGTIHNLTDQQGVRAVYPRWSPDGEKIVFYSDETGEYEVYMMENKEDAEPDQITKGSQGWKYPAVWSPNSEYIVFFDRSMDLQLLEVSSGDVEVIDRAKDFEIRDYSFSPDSKWVAYTQSNSNNNSSVMVYNVENGESTQLTGYTFSESNPVFSKCGNYLFFTSNRDFNLEFSSFEFNYLYNDATKIYALYLNDESPRLFAPEETVEPGAADEDNNEKEEENGEEEDEMTISIDFDDPESRVVALPMSSGSYWGLQSVDEGLVYFNSDGMHLFNLKEEESKEIMPGVRMAMVSADGKKFLYSARGDYGVASLQPGQKVGDGKLDLSSMDMKIDPRQEWEQIFRDGWRIFRDFFYVENLHNVDWEEIYDQYAVMLPYVNHRMDLDYLFGELIAETNTGHAYVNYGDFETVDRIDTGLLGAELSEDGNRYVISKIYEGENWNSSRKSPLTVQGVDINEGDYIIAIEGQEVTTDDNPYMFLENRVGVATRITVSANANGSDARTYIIHPIDSELELKYHDWVESRREMVNEMSDGRIGYFHVPNTAVEGNRELHRGMYAYHDKEALIIDERFNGGGFIPDRMIELLGRQTMAHWARQGIEPMRTPGVAHDGLKAMLINYYASSGGDALPYFFRKNNLGTILGTRTWGGLVGMTGNARLMDGGYIGVPRFGIYNEDGEWIIEGIGIYPDIEVVDWPHLVAQGQDPTLEKAVEVLLEQLEENPPKKWRKPAEGPDRSGWIEQEID